MFIKAEIVDDMEKDKPKDPESLVVLGKNTVLATRFTMVAIDSATRKPVKINPLLTTSPAEERLFEMGEINKKRKKQYAEISLSRQPPTPEERLAIHDVYLQYSKYAESSGQDGFATPKNHEALQNLPNNLVWMRNTTIESNYLMMPQDRNIHNNIFGGYLMRRAYELAYADASLFMKSASPIMLSMDEVTFRKPVHVGSLLNLSSSMCRCL